MSADEQARAHEHLLAADAPMAALARAHGAIDPYVRPHRVPVHDGDLFEGLVFHVVGQSISERSALAVFARIRGLLGAPTVTAGSLAAVSPRQLHQTGLSMTKARTLSDLGHAVHGGGLDLSALRSCPDHEVVGRLTSLRGIGPWTAEIFLLYELRRPDAFPGSEIGLRHALQALDGLPDPPPAGAAHARAEGWRPYRSYAAGHLWRSLH